MSDYLIFGCIVITVLPALRCSETDQDKDCRSMRSRGRGRQCERV